LTALEDPELEAAGERIEAYCGVDNFIATAPETPDPGDGGGGVVVGGSIPEGFPEELVPAGANVVAQSSVAGTLTVVFEVAAPVADIIDFYSQELGDPMSVLSDPAGALWTVFDDAGLLNVIVTEVDSGITNATVSVPVSG
jgi:hypothetical protein